MEAIVETKGNIKSSRIPEKIKGNLWYDFTKRVFDFVSSLLVILLISPILLIIFIIQLFVTKGHPIFFDKRVGKKGKDIVVYKFRSMYYDAESNIDKYLTPEQKEIWLRERKLDDDSVVEMICFSFKKMHEDPNMNKFYTEYPSVEEILEDFNIKSIVVDGSTDIKLFRNYIPK